MKNEIILENIDDKDLDIIKEKLKKNEARIISNLMNSFEKYVDIKKDDDIVENTTLHLLYALSLIEVSKKFDILQLKNIKNFIVNVVDCLVLKVELINSYIVEDDEVNIDDKIKISNYLKEINENIEKIKKEVN